MSVSFSALVLTAKLRCARHSMISTTMRVLYMASSLDAWCRNNLTQRSDKVRKTVGESEQVNSLTCGSNVSAARGAQRHLLSLSTIDKAFQLLYWKQKCWPPST